MLIDIVKLKSGVETYTNIDLDVVIDQELLNKHNILDLKDTKVVGKLTKSIDDYNIDIILKGIFVLPCSVSLKPVDYPFEVQIDGQIGDLLEEIGESSKKTQNTIDIFPIIWENILMEIPIRVVSPNLDDVVTEGQGWQLINEEVRNDVNPELQKLKDLFK